MTPDPKEVDIWLAYYCPQYFPAHRLPALLQELEDVTRRFTYGREIERPGRIAALRILINNPQTTTP